MALIASNYGNQIYLGATAGDTTKDKDYVFKSQVEGLLNYFALDTHKVRQKGYPYTINIPFKGLSKAEILRLFIKEKGATSNLLQYSRSCYNGKEKECGLCRACLRKAVAFELNDLDGYEKWFEVDPLLNITEHNDDKMRERKTEKDDYLKAVLLAMERRGK